MAQPCIQSSSRGSRSPAMEQCGGCKQCLNSAMQHPEFLNNRTVPSVSHPFPIRFPSVSHPFPIRFPSVSHPFPIRFPHIQCENPPAGPATFHPSALIAGQQRLRRDLNIQFYFMREPPPKKTTIWKWFLPPVKGMVDYLSH